MEDHDVGVNDVKTLIAIAPVSPVAESVVPPRNDARPMIAARQFGWGLHADAQGRLALVPAGSERYRELFEDPGTKVVRAMRSGK